MSKRHEASEARTEEQGARNDETARRAEQASQDSGQNMGLGDDLTDLDLTIEVVEERISPSETNVFDK